LNVDCKLILMQVHNHIDDYYTWREESGLEAVKYWLDESEMENCNRDSLMYFGDQLSAIVCHVAVCNTAVYILLVNLNSFGSEKCLTIPLR